MAYLPVGSVRAGRNLKKQLELTSNPELVVRRRCEVVPVVDLSPELYTVEFVALTGSNPGGAGQSVVDMGVPDGEYWEILACSSFGTVNMTGSYLYDVSGGGYIYDVYAAATFHQDTFLKGCIARKGCQLQATMSAAGVAVFRLQVRKYHA